MMSIFALKKKRKVKGVYGKRTTYYRNHQFNNEKPLHFTKMRSIIWTDVYNKSEEYWDENRFENLTDELGVYKMLDTLQTVKKFKQIYSTVQVWSGFVQFKILITVLFFSTFGSMK
jgi:hypothetical protein